MAIQECKEREKAERHRLIITSAREPAETEGWDAVTTRRLAEAGGTCRPAPLTPCRLTP
ncbi:hypothetical protein [Streptosporangium sp. NPDC000396]|uniref:hypothetical protein n=1 Tax=Streptosporangium sp. NPDC000396 TaxID=3366185 RepID=UPI0036972603